MSKRPLTLDDYIGQERVKTQLMITMGACRKNNKTLPHMLLSGNPGLGKTTLAEIIANEVGTNLTTAMGGNLQCMEDIQDLLAPMSDDGGDIIFIDEIHRMPIKIEEMLYSAMEDFTVIIDIGKGTRRYSIPSFTLIGATTLSGDLSRPLRDRFGLKFQLQNYQMDEIGKIILNLSKRVKAEIDRDAINEISKRSKGIARIAINYFDRCKEYADYVGDGKIDGDSVAQQFALMGIDEIGLDENDLTVLKYLSRQSRPVGIAALSTGCDIDKPTIENIIEPYLLQTGMVNRTSGGREITDRGLAWINAPMTQPVAQVRSRSARTQRLGVRNGG
jgi:Holliday junction DNA helicase RuvB